MAESDKDKLIDAFGDLDNLEPAEITRATQALEDDKMVKLGTKFLREKSKDRFEKWARDLGKAPSQAPTQRDKRKAEEEITQHVKRPKLRETALAVLSCWGYKFSKFLARSSNSLVIGLEKDNSPFVAKLIKMKEDVCHEIEMLKWLKDAPNILKLQEAIPINANYSHALIFHAYTSADKLTPTNSEELRDFMRQVVQAVAQCHERGIIHHDIKLSNILFSRGTRGLDVKLCDFGLAVNEENVSKLDFAGTYGWIAPDQISLGKVSKATDMWAVGMVFASSLVGNSFVPSHCDDYMKLVEWSLTYETELVRRLQESKLDPLAEDLLISLLKKDPEERITAEDALNHMYLK